MGMYNIIDDISRKQILKSETGDSRIFGVVVATVVENYEQSMPGRICIAITNRNGKVDENNPAQTLKWARVAMPSSGSGWGHYFLPEIGDQVLVVFEEGNIEKPYIIGCVPKDKDKFLTSTVEETNKFKRIQTRNGSNITFTDEKVEEGNGEDPGSKDRIEIQTAGKEHIIFMDNDKDKICIQSKGTTPENKIEIYTKEEEGKIDIKTVKNLTITVGDEIKVIMNGSSGKVTIEAKSLDLKTQGNVNVESNGSVKTSGKGVKMESSTSFEIKGQSTLSLDGGMVNIG